MSGALNRLEEPALVVCGCRCARILIYPGWSTSHTLSGIIIAVVTPDPAAAAAVPKGMAAEYLPPWFAPW